MSSSKQEIDELIYGFSFKSIIDAVSDAVVVTKAFPLDFPGPEIVYVNDAFTRMSGYTAEDMLGHSPRIVQSDETDVATRARIRSALNAKESVQVKIKNKSKSGHLYWVELNIVPIVNRVGEVTHFAALQRDISEHIEEVKSLESLSNTDYLTQLLNRRAFEQILASTALDTSKNFSLIMFDIDHFKQVNDLYGHDIGDRVLVSLAALCRSHFRQEDIIARTGGEEFMVLVRASLVEANRIADNLRHKVMQAQVAFEQDQTLSFTVSMGVVAIDSPDIQLLLKKADQAMYSAKKSGRNCVVMG